MEYPADFIAAVQSVLADEKGYVDRPDDSGGPTNFGISQRQYPHLDIKSLTKEDAIAIYYRDFWVKFSFDQLPATISAKVFNLAVLMGPHSAIVCLQHAIRACGYLVADDGVIGPQTSRAAGTIEIASGVANGMTGPDYKTCSPLMAALRSEAAGELRIRIALNAAFEEDARGWIDRAYE